MITKCGFGNKPTSLAYANRFYYIKWPLLNSPSTTITQSCSCHDS